MYLLPFVWRPTTLFVHYMHVTAGGLRPITNRQQSLFEQPKLTDLKHAINSRVGIQTIPSRRT
jgi:hypothetical protein